MRKVQTSKPPTSKLPPSMLLNGKPSASKLPATKLPASRPPATRPPATRLQNSVKKESLRSSSRSTGNASFKEKNNMAANAELTPVIDAQTIQAAQEALENAPSTGDAPGVDKIRELLFGNQMQDYDRRFAVLEQRFQQNMRDLEGESARGFQSMESSVKKQMESIASQVRQEQTLRAEADNELGRGLREQIQGLEKRISKVSDDLATLDREFSERLEHESQTLREEIKRRTEDTRATIERMFSELSNVKTDRNLLAGLFVEIARCLNQDLTAKANGGSRDKGQRS